ncbi:hypothetical protein [Chlamydia caviae]|uniref:Uncharacterized protein n=1 Tax=Chlamydia caviae (strain ATCC VR-813 / DSM 19441 / 03DC25 / GPIC) TaxID=227941 RepID=Q823R9_CHLCV|nr:hypothetical protein [Chlamydia caviae]AAP05085.1 hypothetical protein CCA_00337 [Chlamydia caviae GPIC]
MLFGLTIIPPHTHTNKNNATQDVKSSIIQAPKVLATPNSKASILQKIASCTPIIGLLVVPLVLYQKRAVAKKYKELEYIPCNKCPHTRCSLLDPSNLNIVLSASLLGGLGLLFPFIILLLAMVAIIALVEKIRSCCQRPPQQLLQNPLQK